MKVIIAIIISILAIAFLAKIAVPLLILFVIFFFIKFCVEHRDILKTKYLIETDLHRRQEECKDKLYESKQKTDRAKYNADRAKYIALRAKANRKADIIKAKNESKRLKLLEYQYKAKQKVLRDKGKDSVSIICSYCNNRINKEVNKCPYCGAKI